MDMYEVDLVAILCLNMSFSEVVFLTHIIRTTPTHGVNRRGDPNRPERPPRPKATEHLQKAVRSMPTNATARYLRGMRYLESEEARL